MAVALAFKVSNFSSNIAANGSITVTGLTTSGASLIVVAVGVGNNSSSTVSSMTVNGNAASLGKRQIMPDGFSNAEVWTYWSSGALASVSVVATFANSSGAGGGVVVCEATGTDAASVGNTGGANGNSGTSAASATCSASGSVMFGGSLNWGNADVASTNTVVLSTLSDLVGDYTAASNNSQSTTSGNSYTITTTHTSEAWAMAVVEIKQAAAALVPPPRPPIPIWPDPPVAPPRGPVISALLATPPVVDNPLPYRRPAPGYDWWPSAPVPQMRLGVAAILATAVAASAQPVAARPVPEWPTQWSVRTPSFVAAILAPAPAPPDAPPRAEIGRRAISLWSSDWTVRPPPPKSQSIFATSRFPLVASGRKLLDAQGARFTIKGRTAWGMAGLTNALRASFLDNTVSYGFTAVEVQIPGHLANINGKPFDGNGNAPFLKRLDGANWSGTLTYGNINNEAPDFTTPNPLYWNFVDGIVEDCRARGLLLMMFPAYLGIGGSDGWTDEMTANGTTKITAYGAFVADRYKLSSHIVWMTAGDTNSGYDNELALITGIQSVTGRSLHFSAERGGGSISSDGTAPLGATMTLNGAYDWATVIAQCRRARATSIPSYMLEEPYDEEGTDGTGVNNTFSTQPTRRYEWWGVLNTPGGYVAGNGYIWRFALTGTPLATDDYRNHLNTQATTDLGRLNAFIETWTQWDLLEASGINGMRTLIPSGSGAVDSSTYIAAACATDGTLTLAYYPPGSSGAFTVDLRSMAGTGIRARWWDPTAGTYSTNASAAGTFTLLNTASAQSFTPPATNGTGEADFVLVLDAAAEQITVGPRSRVVWAQEDFTRQPRPGIAAVLATTPAANPPPPVRSLALALWVDPIVALSAPRSVLAPVISGQSTTPPPLRLVAPSAPADAWTQPSTRPGIAATVQYFPPPLVRRQPTGWGEQAPTQQPRPGIAAVVQDFPPPQPSRLPPAWPDQSQAIQPRVWLAAFFSVPAPSVLPPPPRALVPSWPDQPANVQARTTLAPLLTPATPPDNPPLRAPQQPTGWTAQAPAPQARPGSAALLPQSDLPPPRVTQQPSNWTTHPSTTTKMASAALLPQSDAPQPPARQPPPDWTYPVNAHPRLGIAAILPAASPDAPPPMARSMAAYSWPEQAVPQPARRWLAAVLATPPVVNNPPLRAPSQFQPWRAWDGQPAVLVPPVMLASLIAVEEEEERTEPRRPLLSRKPRRPDDTRSPRQPFPGRTPRKP